MHDFRWVIKILDKFWVAQKGSHLGHGFLEDLPGDLDRSAKGKLGDAGLLFAHSCLKILDSRMTRRSTSSIIRGARTQRGRVK